MKRVENYKTTQIYVWILGKSYKIVALRDNEWSFNFKIG